VQTLPSLQITAGPGLQLPKLHVSGLVQKLLSVHGKALLRCWQPSVASQLSLVQTFRSSQLIAGPGLQALAAQTSGVVHTLLSVHGAALAAKTQPKVTSQLSLVQMLLSLQFSTGPGMQLPPEHLSPLVQTVLSVQTMVLLV